MTLNELQFSNSAVGVAFLNPEKTGTTHLLVNPEAGAIVLAEAHPIRLVGKNSVTVSMLDELGQTATSLISEYVSNYVNNSRKEKDAVIAKDPAFRNLLGQTVSGLDQMLIDTVTSGNENMAAYQLDESAQKSLSKNSLLNQISNNLEAIVYYDGGIHISHRGESQQYLVGKRVQKLTQDHIAGGLFNKMGDLGDFIPEVHTNTLAMNTNDQLVLFSRDAAVSSFPLQQLKQWLGDGEPRDQAQRVAEHLKQLGKERGCVVVFSPGWEGSRSDDIASNGMFSLMNLANLEKNQTGTVSVIPGPTSSPNGEMTAQTSMSPNTSTFPKESKRDSRISSNRIRPKARNSSLKLKSRTSWAAGNFSSGSASVDPFEPQRSHRRSILESEIDTISQKVSSQLSIRLEELEIQIHADVNERLSKMRKDILAKAGGEVHKAFTEWVETELPQLEDRQNTQRQEEISNLEMRLTRMMGKGIAELRTEINRIKTTLTTNKETTEPSKNNTTEITDDELEIQELQQSDLDSIEFSTIPSAIFGTTRKPVRPPSTKTIKTTQIRKVASKSLTLPAPAAYPTHATAPDEEVSVTTKQDVGESTEEINGEVNKEAVTPSVETVPLPPSDVQNSNAEEQIAQFVTADSIYPENTTLSNYKVSTPKFKIVAVVLVAIVGLLGAGAFLVFSPLSPFATPHATPNRTTATVDAPSGTNTVPTVDSNKTASLGKNTTPTTATTDAIESNVPPKPAKKAGTAEQPNTDTNLSPPPKPTPEVIAQNPITPSPYIVEPKGNMSTSDLYDQGMRFYKMGDASRDGKKKLSRLQQHEALTSALVHFDEIRKQNGAIPINLWYVKGRTEYNLTKTEKSAARRREYAQSALNSYQRYQDLDDTISTAKMKTLKRNIRTLKQIIRTTQ